MVLVDEGFVRKGMNHGQINKAQMKLLGVPSLCEGWAKIAGRMGLILSDHEAAEYLKLRSLTRAQRVDAARKANRLASSNDIFLDILKQPRGKARNRW